MRVILNIHSSFNDIDKKAAAFHNSRVYSDTELLNAYVGSLSLGQEEVSEIYKSAILNRMADAGLFYNLLDNIERLDEEVEKEND